MNINTYSGIYVNSEGLFIPTANFNGLFVINDDKQTKYLGNFVGSNHSLAWTIVASHIVNREIYFFSFYNFCFWKLNLDTNKLEFIDYYSNENESTIISVEFVNNQFWIFPSTSKLPILVYDCNTNVVSELKWRVDLNEGSFSITKTVVYGNKIFLVNRKINHAKLITIDCENKTICYEPILNALNVNAVAIADNVLWILYLHKNHEVVLEKCNLSDNTKQLISLRNSIVSLNEKDIMYYQLRVCDGYIYAFSTVDNHVLAINIENFQVKKLYNSKLKDIKLSTQEFVLQEIQKVKEGYLIYSPNLGKIQLLDIKEKKINTLDYQLNKFEINRAYNNSLKKSVSLFLEKDIFDFECFIQNIQNIEIKDASQSDTNGEKIYNFLINE